MKRILFSKFIIVFGSFIVFGCTHEFPPAPEKPPSKVTVDPNRNLKVGLVGHYPFSGNAGDSSEKANHGNVNGATLTSDRFGVANKAFNFNGDDYISVSPIPFLNGDFSYCAWVKVNSNPAIGGAACIISLGRVGRDIDLDITNSAGASVGWNFATYTSDTSVTSYTAGSLPTPGIWYYVVGTRDNYGLKIYLDGQLIGNTSVGGPAFYGTTQVAYFGVRTHGNTMFFNGVIDDIRIYNRAITADEVTQLYQLN